MKILPWQFCACSCIPFGDQPRYLRYLIMTWTRFLWVEPYQMTRFLWVDSYQITTMPSRLTHKSVSLPLYSQPLCYMHLPSLSRLPLYHVTSIKHTHFHTDTVTHCLVTMFLNAMEANCKLKLQWSDNGLFSFHLLTCPFLPHHISQKLKKEQTTAVEPNP